MCRSVSNVVVMFERIPCIFRISNPVLLNLNEMKVKNATRNGQTQQKANCERYICQICDLQDNFYVYQVPTFVGMPVNFYNLNYYCPIFPFYIPHENI